jgi:hypothetical protein
VVVVPAVVGPYDLGTVAVRAALYVNPATAQVTAISDPLPLIIEGVPLRLRSAQLSLDRPAFTLNPTNCAGKSIAATVFGNEGAQAQVARHFQVANCAELPYGPKISLKFTGGVNRRGHPAIHGVVTARPGESNTQGVSVTLPSNELLDNSHLRTICTNVAFEREECPPGSLVGQAEATTPLLEQPLSGPVYLRSSSHRLPDLVVDLKGQIGLELDGRVDSVKGGLRTTFEAVPDAPCERFVRNLAGGKKGLVSNSESLCLTRHRTAKVTMTGQNGVRTRGKTRLRAACGSKRGARHHRARATRHGRRR